MPGPVARLVALLDLERIDDRNFRGRTPPEDSTRVFGGQVAAQALVAAGRTVDADRRVHSLHAYFLRPGDPLRPIIYDVDPIRDGGTFTTRRVVGQQDGEAIFHLAASFARPRPSRMEHQVPLSPDIPGPEDLPSYEDVIDEVDPKTREWWSGIRQRRPLDIRFVRGAPVRAQVARGELVAPTEQMWIRSAETLPDDPLIHVCAATFASDLMLLGAALPPHGYTYGDEGLVAASLDHAVWFHREFRADEWFLYDQEGSWAGGGRALCRGRIFDRQGRLLATVLQEGLLNFRDPVAS
jgi:acyl-CoA thioesterase-2